MNSIRFFFSLSLSMKPTLLTEICNHFVVLQVASGNKVPKITSRGFRWKTGNVTQSFLSSFCSLVEDLV